MRYGQCRNITNGETIPVIKILVGRLTTWVSRCVKETSSSRILGSIFARIYAAVPVGDCISESKVNLLSRKTFFAFGLGLLVLVISASTCETNPKWDIRGGNPPQFVFSGSGRLISLRVYGPGERRSESDVEPYGMTYWEIRPKYAYDLQTHANLPSVSYGRVPEDFVQIYPEGSSPKPLFE